MNIFIFHVHKLEISWCIKSMFAGCRLYADHIILVYPSVSGVQNILDLSVCLKFNPLKSCCLGVYKLGNRVYEPLRMDSTPVQWVHSVEYLGISVGRDSTIFQ